MHHLLQLSLTPSIVTIESIRFSVEFEGAFVPQFLKAEHQNMTHNSVIKKIGKDA